MINTLLILSAAGTAQTSAPEPARGVQAVAMATVEIIASARATVEAGPQEPRRQVRRNAAGQATVEFE